MSRTPRTIAIHKFGGTSLGDASRIRNAARLLAAARRRRSIVAVASAMGGVTDVLLDAARELGVRFDEAPLRELDAALQGVSLLRERTARVTDLVSSFGERLSAPLLAAALAKAGVPARAVDARDMLVTDDRHGAATCDRKKSDPRVRRRLRPLLASGVLPVVTGFIARSVKGETTTLGRSGSDTTAALLGAALLAREVVIWTDVDGVLSADPRLVRGA